MKYNAGNQVLLPRWEGDFNFRVFGWVQVWDTLYVPANTKGSGSEF